MLAAGVACRPNGGDFRSARRIEPLENRMRMHWLWTWSPLLLITGALILLPGAASAQSSSLTLGISPSSIAFPSGDPDTTPVLMAGALTVTYGVKDKNKNDAWTLTVQASGDLVSGSAVIPAANVSWTATPAPPFRNGVLSAAVAQTLATSTTDVNPPATGTVVFSLSNSWSYNVGTYSQTIVFTITST
jgi:hypothetical protein